MSQIMVETASATSSQVSSSRLSIVDYDDMWDVYDLYDGNVTEPDQGATESVESVEAVEVLDESDDESVEIEGQVKKESPNLDGQSLDEYILRRKNESHYRAFEHIVGTICRIYNHILDDDERYYVGLILSLEERARWLFVRIFDRNYRNHNQLKHNFSKYLAKEDLEPALDQLLQLGLIHRIRDDIQASLEALNKERLRQILRTHKQQLSGNKTELIERITFLMQDRKRQLSIRGECASQAVVNTIQKVHGGTHYIDREVNRKLIFMYRLYNLDASFDEDALKRRFLKEIRRQNYPKYTIDETPLFKSRQEAEEFLEAEQVRTLFDETTAHWKHLPRQELLHLVDYLLEEGSRLADPGYRPPNTHLPKCFQRFSKDYSIARTMRRAYTVLQVGYKDLSLRLLNLLLQQKHYLQRSRPSMLTDKIALELARWKKIKGEGDDLAIDMELDVFAELGAEGLKIDRDCPAWLDLEPKLKSITKILKDHSRPVSWELKTKTLSSAPVHTVVCKKQVKPDPKEEQEKPAPKPAKKEPSVNSKARKLHKNQALISNFFKTVKQEKHGINEKPKSVYELDQPETVETIQTVQTVQTVQAGPVGLRTGWMSKSGSPITVEACALEDYEKQGYVGRHNEGRGLTSIFGLLFHDILFMDMDGVFVHDCQTAPLDLFSGTDFYYARRHAIEERFEQISTEDGLLTQLRRAIDIHLRPKTMIVGVKWFAKYADNEEWARDLLNLASYMGSFAIVSICRRLLLDYPRYSSGFPDLCLLHHPDKRAVMVEVKSLNDTLSSTQKLWIDHFLSIGVRVELCKVLSEEQNAQAEEKERVKEQKKMERETKRLEEQAKKARAKQEKEAKQKTRQTRKTRKTKTQEQEQEDHTRPKRRRIVDSDHEDA
uniref:Fanconi-associated nuclease n=1 Tax=Blastobotrys adeninivorans TaxID=409370 RepID=A0A060SX62_BLAAD